MVDLPSPDCLQEQSVREDRSSAGVSCTQCTSRATKGRSEGVVLTGDKLEVSAAVGHSLCSELLPVREERVAPAAHRRMQQHGDAAWRGLQVMHRGDRIHLNHASRRRLILLLLRDGI